MALREQCLVCNGTKEDFSGVGVACRPNVHIDHCELGPIHRPVHTDAPAWGNDPRAYTAASWAPFITQRALMHLPGARALEPTP
eukprot:10573121-Alexandrium_andersonii.AAC.1